MFQRSQTNLGCAPMGASQPSDSLTTRSCQTHHPSQLRRHPVSGGRGSSSHCSCEACFDVLQLEPHPHTVFRALAQRGSPRSKTVRPLLLRRLRDHTVLQEVDFVCLLLLHHGERATRGVFCRASESLPETRTDGTCFSYVPKACLCLRVTRHGCHHSWREQLGLALGETTNLPFPSLHACDPGNVSIICREAGLGPPHGHSGHQE